MSSVQRELRPVGAISPSNDEQVARRQAIEQIERKRKFWYQTLAGGVGMLLLAAIWAITEYQNSGGWPTDGFGESSGIPHVWNMWIIYPVIAWVFFSGVHGISVYIQKPITESQIRREMERHR
jgi:2TM domain-containing protein